MGQAQSGPEGPEGPEGPMGAQGPRGLKGDTGPTGPAGKDSATDPNTLVPLMAADNALLTNLGSQIAKSSTTLSDNVATSISNNQVSREQIVNSLTTKQTLLDAIANTLTTNVTYKNRIQGPAGTIADADSIAGTLKPRTLWCADGSVVGGTTTKICSTPDATTSFVVKTRKPDGTTQDRDILTELDRLNRIITGSAETGDVTINTAGGKWVFQADKKLKGPTGGGTLEDIRKITNTDTDFYIERKKGDASINWGFQNNGALDLPGTLSLPGEWKIANQENGNIHMYKGGDAGNWNLALVGGSRHISVGDKLYLTRGTWNLAAPTGGEWLALRKGDDTHATFWGDKNVTFYNGVHTANKFVLEGANGPWSIEKGSVGGVIDGNTANALFFRGPNGIIQARSQENGDFWTGRHFWAGDNFRSYKHGRWAI